MSTCREIPLVSLEAGSRIGGFSATWRAITALLPSSAVQILLFYFPFWVQKMLLARKSGALWQAPPI